MTEGPDQEQNPSDDFRRVLNTHGYSFQYSVLRRVDQLLNNGKSAWKFKGSEFPVVAGSQPIHIDFVLEQFWGNRQTALYLVGGM